MRKTKENSANPARAGDSQTREGEETENEEHAEAVGGETSTEGVGRGFDAEDREGTEIDEAESSADGPLSGDVNVPPEIKRAVRNKKTKNAQHGIAPADGPSNHAAANSSRSI